MDSDNDPWQRVYNVIVKGHSDIGVRLDRIDDRLGEIERAAETRHGEYMGQFEELRHRVGDRLVSKEASTTPPPPKRRRAS